MTKEQYIEVLKAQVDAASYNCAIVDYLGYRSGLSRADVITEATPPRDRYGVRGRSHVEIYKFPTLYTNYGENA